MVTESLRANLKEPGSAARLALAALIPVCAFALQQLLWPFIQPHVWILFLPAVLISSRLGGFRGGMLATGLSALFVWYAFLPPRFSFEMEHLSSVFSLAVFLVMGLFFSVALERQREARQRADHALASLRLLNEDLENQVRNRTTSLSQLNEKLAANAELLSMLGDNIPGGALYQLVEPPNAPAYYSYMSAGIERILGYSRESVMADPAAFWRQIVEEDRARVDALQRESAARLVPFDCIFHQCGASGERKCLHARSTPKRLDDGTLIWDGVVVDDTEREQAEAKGKESLRKLAAALASMRDAVFISDLHREFIHFNDAFATFHRFTNREACFRQFGDYPAILELYQLTGERVPVEEWPVPRALRGETATNAEYRLVRSDTGETWFGSFSFAPIRDASGAIVGSVAVSRDVTDQKRVAEELKAKERLLGEVIDLVPHHIFAKDREGRFLFVNRAASACRGLEPQNLIGRSEKEFLFNPAQTDAFLRDDREVIDSGQTKFIPEELITYVDGSRHWLQTVKRAFVPPGATERAVLGVAVDITDRKLADEKIRSLNAELELRVIERTSELAAANKELEAFSYSVSHDLRTPLRHVQGYVDMLKRETAGQLSEKGQRYLDVVADSSRKMDALISDLLAFSRTGRQLLRETAVPLDEVVQEVLGELEIAMRGRNIVWSIHPLPAVLGDRALLKQVFVNLLSNAVKFTRPRDPARIGIGSEGLKEDRVVLFVRDNGVGFDPSYSNRLFKVFQRLHRSEEFEGTGIGLANVARIVARHGGRAWAEGALGGGATFFIALKPSPETASASAPAPEALDKEQGLSGERTAT